MVAEANNRGSRFAAPFKVKTSKTGTKQANRTNTIFANMFDAWNRRGCKELQKLNYLYQLKWEVQCIIQVPCKITLEASEFDIFHMWSYSSGGKCNFAFPLSLFSNSLQMAITSGFFLTLKVKETHYSDRNHSDWSQKNEMENLHKKTRYS